MIPSADLILHNAHALTMLPYHPRAGMVAIRGDRILVVGRQGGWETWQGRGTRVIDCGGMTIVPGFIDAHCHVLAFVQRLLSLDFSPTCVSSIQDIIEALRQRAAQVPPGIWLTGTGYNEFYLEEKRHPNRWELDRATPHHPIRLLHRSGHAQVLNSLALSLVGIGMETPEPPGGLIDRDLETGEPNGLLFEMNAQVAEKVPPLSQEELRRGLALADQAYLSQGITSLQDASVSNSPAQWQLFSSIKAEGRLTPRLNQMIGHTHLDSFLAQGLTPGQGDSQLRLGAVKVVLDESSGSLHPPQAELNELVRRAQERGWQVALHAIDTVEAAVAALESALTQHPRPHRHRLEHASVCPPQALERLARLGAVVVTQPAFLYYSGERYLSEVPRHQLPYLYRLRSFLEAGLRPAAGSDSPVVPLNPLVGMYSAVTRRAETGQTILLEEAVSPAQALAMYTAAAAYAQLAEGEKGSLAPGMLADLVLLSGDPTRLPAEEIKGIRVEMTLVGGRVVWG